NLLFGLMALQMDFITRDDLIAAMRDWALQKSAPLGQILVEHKALSSERRRMLDALVAERIEQHNGDTQKSLESLPTNGEAKAALAMVPDLDVQSSLSRLRAQDGKYAQDGKPASPPDPCSTLTQAAVPEEPVRYRPLRTHARGGLGQVYIAMDEELHREVALKEI